jgi:putative ABC transport system permease protein
VLSQTLAVTGINVRSIPERWATSLVIVIGLAGVVAVFTALLAMATGFQKTLQAAGRPDAAIIMRGSSETEINSALDRDSTDLIKQAKGIRIGPDGKPVASAELIVITELVRTGGKAETDAANVTLRGVEHEAFVLRPQLKIVEGRMFSPGLRELIVGRGAAKQFSEAALGKTLHMRGSDWSVVGIFESGDAYESELWADTNMARTTFGRTGSSAVHVAFEGPQAFEQLKSALAGDPRLTVDVVSEQDYFNGQTKQFRQTIGVLATVVTIIMGLGALFAALNSMYAAVASRSKEIATLRAIGFGGAPVLLSIMIEALLLAVAGGLIGAVLAYVLFNGMSVSTIGQNFTQVVFNFKVTPELVVRGLVISVLIGMIGGLFPAIRAARLPVTTGLREL